MKILKAALLLSLLLIAGIPVFAQQDTVGIRTIIAKQGKYAENYPVEKVYLHLDKPNYATGDTLWFKAYVTIDLHQPTILSKIVYVDMISSTDTLIQSLRLPVINGFAQGNIVLDPKVYQQGNYHIRAYTEWMRNFDPAYFFNKNIPVANADKQINARAVFTANGKGPNTSTSARVIYHDAEGNPYSNKKVSWRIETLDKTLDKGKGVTDQNGILQVSVPPVKSADAGPANLIVTIDGENKKTYTNSFTVNASGRDNDVQFFPEGGKLIAGSQQKVAFKALRPDGLGIDVKGSVTDNDGKAVASFTSQHLGMGVFMLTPESGKTYKATVSFSNGAQQTFTLPAVQQSGVSLIVNNTLPDQVEVNLVANDAYFEQNKGKPYYIIAKIGETVCYAAQALLQTKSHLVSIGKSKLVSGVLQITLFANNGQPLAERVTFIQNNDLLNLTAHTERPSYGKRQKVKLMLTAKNQLQPAEANLSVAVVDETKVPYDENSDNNILSHLLLVSDLQGYIEKPGYYFNHPTDKTAADLDVLMLTQGYRRFAYTDLLAGRMPQVRYPAEQGIDITGTLRTSTGMPVGKGSVRLTLTDRNYSANAVTDPSGNFKFANVPLVDSSKAVISARGNYHSNTMMLMVDGATVPALTQNITAPDAIADIDSTYRAYIKNRKQQDAGSHMLKEVVIKGTAPVRLPTHADYPTLSGLSSIPDHVINGDRLEGCNNLLTCLQTAAMGLTYADDNFYITRNYNSGNRTPVQVFINGMAVDVNALNGIAPSEVLSAEIFLKDELGLVNRVYNSDGVLAINTKGAALKSAPKTKISLADLQNMLPRNDEVTISPQGYTIARQFYSPQYSPTKTSGIGVDLRSTIYWNPQVKTDKTGAASVEFFNADGHGNYRVITEGMDAEGHIGRVVYKYKVE